ncbi:hypothetical protein [Paraburkholderia panacisoli]|nr:hypothetical protein [Paraburkholderia panacisoli]
MARLERTHYAVVGGCALAAACRRLVLVAGCLLLLVSRFGVPVGA